MCYQTVSFVLGFCYKDYFYILNGIFKYQDCSLNQRRSEACKKIWLPAKIIC